MPAFTVNANANWTDATFVTRAGSDTYTLGVNVTLTIDSDTRYGPNCSSTTGNVSTPTFSAAGASGIYVDGSKVRLIPFNAGSGNVPAVGTTISQGAVSAELLGVWAGLSGAPTAAGAAMPASGFIKVRNKAGGDFAAGALTGIGATSKRADIVGWIEVAVVAGMIWQPGKLGTVEFSGQWWYAVDADGNDATTTGVRNQTIQLPASLTNTYYAGVWIEETAGSNVWRMWPNAWPLQNASFATDERARQVWIDNNGLLRIGNDGVNDVGLMPAAGCRIRVGNILTVHTNTTVGYGANANILTGRVLGRTGNWIISKATIILGMQAASSYIYELRDVGLLRDHIHTQPLVAPYIDGVIGAPLDTTDAARFAFGPYSSGGTIKNVVACRAQTATGYTQALYVGGIGLTIQNVRGQSFINAAAAAVLSVAMVVRDSTIDGVESVGGGTQFDGEYCTLKRWRHSYTAFGTVPSTPATGFWGNVMTSRGWDISDFDWLIPTPNTCHANGSALAQMFTGTKDFVLHSIGSRAAPLNKGSVNSIMRVVVASFQSLSQGLKIHNVWTSGGSTTDYASASTNEGLIVEGGGTAATVINSSSPLGLVKGLRTNNVYFNRNVVTFGVHWSDLFLSDTTGTIEVLLHDPHTATVAQMQILAGSPKYLNNGTMVFGTVGDQVEWTQPYFAQGHTALSSLTFTGPAAANYTIEFRADTGSGWSAWQLATPANLSAVAITPTIGVRLGLRITCNVASATVVSVIRFLTASTLAAQQALAYPLRTATLTVVGLMTGSRIRMTRRDTGAVLLNEAEAGGSVALSTDYQGLIDIEARKASAAPFYQPWVAVADMSLGNTTITALQVRDDL